MLRAKLDLLPDVEVVAVAELASSTGAVEGVLLVVELLAGGPVEVGDGADVLEKGQAALGVVGAIEVDLETGVDLVLPRLGRESGSDELRGNEERGTHRELCCKDR